MAKAELSVLLQDLRGKAGNTVFQKSRDGIIVRPRVQGTNPNTPAQKIVRAALTHAAGLFKAFNNTQYTAWQNYAQNITKHNPVNGKTYHPTAMNAYTELATKYLLVSPNGTPPSTPPSTSFVGDTISVTATAAAGKVTFTASAANTTGITTELMLQPLASANRKPQDKGYRSKAYFTFVSGTLTKDVLVPAGYYAAGYRFVKVATGQATEMIALPVTQVTVSLAQGGKNADAKPSESKKAA